MREAVIQRPSFIPERTDSAGVRAIREKLIQQAEMEEALSLYSHPTSRELCLERAAAFRAMATDAGEYWQAKRAAEQAAWEKNA